MLEVTADELCHLYNYVFAFLQIQAKMYNVFRRNIKTSVNRLLLRVMKPYD